jgi:transketolase
MRREFGRKIVDLAEKDEKIFLIVGDIGYEIFDSYREKFSKRFINFGVREQAMIGFAAGIALEGLKPWVYTITPFLIERPFEQIKINVDQQKANVKLVGYADYPTQGPTHSELDAKGLMRLLKNTISYFPKSSEETREAVIKSYEYEGPVFISLKKDKSK